ncbi:MAG: restriction endonuclease subunit S [Flavobacterium lindanitolerans]|uniref:restriction endonuclease subunit S n=1 Tax=Flavobacterium lindanitolerans TaxID=428988 RepID=UPI001A5DF720|nr:restriction endonuclease subunit S [Flavobacterium lindanitolerans]MBL7867158.1 restriction endonuclease subunit S [Flavobacterium lindanitolerans]
MKKTISDIADIRFGVYSRTEESEGIPYLQVRQFDEYGILNGLPDEFIELDHKSDQQLLKDGDVLFVGKGNRLFAWCYRETDGPYIASSIFFVLRPNQNIIYPEYLSAVLNAPQTKAVFQQIGSGTNIFSIRKSELGAFEIPLPSLEKQKKIAALAELHQKEISLTQHLLNQKRYLYTGIISKLLQ